MPPYPLVEINYFPYPRFWHPARFPIGPFSKVIWNWIKSLKPVTGFIIFSCAHSSTSVFVQFKLDITLQGRGAKHFFPSGSGLGPTFSLIRSRTSLPEQLDFRQYQGMKSRQIKHFVFQNVCKKSFIWWSKKGPWTDRSQSLTSLTAIHFQDCSKYKAQTTSRQQPWNTLHIPLVEINYSC